MSAINIQSIIISVVTYITSSQEDENVTTWRRGAVVVTTAQLHSTKPGLRFCAGSNPARGVSEIRDGEHL